MNIHISTISIRHIVFIRCKVCVNRKLLNCMFSRYHTIHRFHCIIWYSRTTKNFQRDNDFYIIKCNVSGWFIYSQDVLVKCMVLQCMLHHYSPLLFQFVFCIQNPKKTTKHEIHISKV